MLMGGSRSWERTRGYEVSLFHVGLCTHAASCVFVIVRV